MRRGSNTLFTIAWGFLAAVSVVLVLVGGLILYAPEYAAWFSDTVDLGSLDGDTAEHVTLITRLLALSAMGFGILSLFVTLFGVRDRSPLSVSVMWTLPVLIATLGMTLVLDGNNYVGLAMAFLAALMSFALVIARKNT